MIYDPFSSSAGNAPASSGLDLVHGASLLLQGKKTFLLSGEVQFFRMDPSVWETCLRQVKALGLPMVSTYLSWQRFSLGPGEYDLTGATNPRLNLPAFLDLCKAVDLWVTLKPGPWICAEETNGGYPDWLVNDADLQVRDAQDRPVMGYSGPFQSPIPSYLHPKYQDHVRRWLEAVDYVAAPYAYPNGPVVLVQLDNEPGYTFHDRAFESDYNPSIASPGGLYAQWLLKKYGTIQQLNLAHRSTWSSFDEITPPRRLELRALDELPRYMDWVAFKEWTLSEEVRSVGWYHLRNGLARVLFTINFNEHPQLAAPNDWHSLEQASGIGGYDYYPRMPMNAEDFIGVVQALNYSRVVNRVPWSPEIMTGIWSFEGQEHGPHHLPSKEFEYLYLTCLAYGLKGMNFYMLADRDNWVNSPLNEQGELTETAASVQKTVRIMQAMPHFDELEIDQPVGVVYYRPYAREAFLAHESPAVVDGHPLGQAYARFKAVYSELVRLNLNPAIVDLWAAPERLSRHRLVILPAGMYLDDAARERLLDYVRAGGTLAVFPAWPELGLDFTSGASPAPKSTPVEGMGSGDWKAYTLGQGRCVDLAVDQPSTTQLTQLLHLNAIEPAAEASSQQVQTVLHEHDGQKVLFVINTGIDPVEVEISFHRLPVSGLVELPDQRSKWSVSGGKIQITLAGHAVRVYSIIG
ncbi:MAG TPA: beta-galactosidase [Anaerolineaceae bacterium]|nr:beta-galactosidase [Anaerolineaceae bacterium]